MKAILGAMLVFSISTQAVIADELKEQQLIPMSIEKVNKQATLSTISSPIYENTHLVFNTANDAIALPQSTVDQIKTLNAMTVFAKINPQIDGYHSIFGASNSSSGTPNSYFHVYVSDLKLGFEIRRQWGGDIYKSSKVDINLVSGTDNALAFSASESTGYRLFLNGEKILDIPAPTNYKFIKDISGINNAFIGKTTRHSANSYEYLGRIDDVELYNYALDDNTLIQKTIMDISDRAPVQSFKLYDKEAWNTAAFRIPALIRTTSNTIISAADIRYGDSNDSPNNIDVGIRRSSDNGLTWTDPEVILAFDDYPRVPTSQIRNSASYIDSVIVEGHNNRIFLFADAFKGGIGQANSIASTGFVEVGGTKYLSLTGSTSARTQYYLGNDNTVYTMDGSATNYTVGDGFALFENGIEISNIFYKNSPLVVDSTSFIVMIYSDDEGATWSSPKIINDQIKTPNMTFLGVSPGGAITIKNGEHRGRILVPIYYSATDHNVEYANAMYSDDNGVTWQLGESPNDGRIGGAEKLHEAQFVEMPNGQIKMFARSVGRAAIATSLDGGLTWLDTVEYDNTLVMSNTTGCQLSIINYSGYVDGQPAVIFSNPAATKRANGTIRVGLISENGFYDNGEPIYRITWKYARIIMPDEFAYSNLAELEGGNIAILYEDSNTRYKLFHLIYSEFTVDSLKVGQ
ncbi:sialidase domain-containing protein [Photobacterium nomapromontoriensis]|uniref:sialidase domain-containing protein n=1 Tax=Photobacterium nomapromontoriensis TaxID=2910237 RepID=UPI003D1451E2